MVTIDRKDNVRVNDSIPVAYRLVTAEDVADPGRPERFFPFIWNKYPQVLPLEDVEEHHTRMLHHIIELHRKLDVLIETVRPESRTIVEGPEEKEVCISGAGVGSHRASPVLPGQLIV